MKRATWLVATGTVAGFLGVIGLHKSSGPAGLASSGTQPSSRASHAAGPGRARTRATPAGTGGTAGPRVPPWAPWSATATANWPPG